MSSDVLLPWTRDQLNQLISLAQQHGSTKPLEEMIRQVGFPPAELPSRIVQAFSQLGQKAATDHRAVEALSLFSEKFPAAREQLVTIAKIGGRNADVAFRALRDLSTTRPNDVIPLLQRLVQSGSGYASQAIQLLGTLAQQGNVAARTALIEIEKNPAQYGGLLAAAARAVLATMAAVPTTALIAGAVALVGAGLLGGYIWSQSGDQPIQPGPAMTRSRPNPNITDFEQPPGQTGERYFIYAVNTSGWSLYVGPPSAVEGRASRKFKDGGTGDQPVEFKKLVDTPFDSREQAIAHIKAGISTGHDSVWTGRWVKFGGEEYRTAHVGEVNQ